MEDDVVFCDSITKESVDLEYHINCVEISKEEDELSKFIQMHLLNGGIQVSLFGSLL